MQPEKPSKREGIDLDKYDPIKLRRRTMWSIAGLIEAWKNEVSFRTWFYINAVSGLAALFFELTTTETLVVVALGLLVMVAELFNTAFERLADLVEPEFNLAIKATKDCASAAVALTALAWAVCWGVILYRLFFLG